MLLIVCQNFARKYTIPVDTLSFEHIMCEEEKFDQPAEEGVYVYGPFCEGCRWNAENKLLDESLPKVLFTPMPVMHFMPRERPPPSAMWKEEVRDEDGNPAADGFYVAPLYNTAARYHDLMKAQTSCYAVLVHVRSTEAHCHVCTSPLAVQTRADGGVLAGEAC